MSDQNEQAVKPEPTHTVVDNSNIEAVLAEARGEKYVPEEVKPEAKTDDVVEAKVDDEDDNGLTEAERQGLTEKMQKTIGKKHRQKMEAEEFAEVQFREKQLALKRAEVAEREAQRLREQLEPVEEKTLKEPSRNDFKTDKEYTDAMVDYRVELKLHEKEQADHKKALEDLQRETVEAFQERLLKARALVPDFEEVVGTSDKEVPQAVAGYMQESDLGPEIAYHLSKNPEALDKLIKMSPARQLVEIGKIESTLKPFSQEKVTTAKAESQDGKAEKPPSTNGNPPSKARTEPIKPLDTASAAQVTKPESEMTYEEAKAQWAKTHKVNLHVRRRH